MTDNHFDALPAPEIAHRAEDVGIKKATNDTISTFTLAVLAGGFVSMGAAFSTTVVAGASETVPYGIVRLLAGLSFSLGLVLIIGAGAELFTGNSLIIMAWASRKVSTTALLRNWLVVYTGNFVGSILSALLMFLTNQYSYGGGAVGQAALNTAVGKVNHDFVQALALGIMCNAMVCLAVWLTLGARSATDKILAITFPITAFVTLSFEHSIANMYFVPMGLFIKQFDPAFVAKMGVDVSSLTVTNFINTLIPVTIGNIIGGVFMVAAVYWFIYLRPARAVGP
ncbi:MAG: formate/nitrite transporter family protein [Anaerolineae bacterium]